MNERGEWFKQMCLKSEITSHISKIIDHGYRILTVIENLDGNDTNIFPPEGKGTIRCAVINDSHRKDWKISFTSRAENEAMVFCGANSNVLNMNTCEIFVPSDTQLKLIDLVFEQTMDIEVKDQSKTQEIFLTIPTIKPVLTSGTKIKVPKAGKRMIKIVSILRNPVLMLPSETENESLNTQEDLTENSITLTTDKSPNMESKQITNDFLQTRLDQLKDNITEDLNLLREYEDSFRLEDEPRRKAKYQKEINELKKSASKYAEEYSELEQKTLDEGLPTQALNSELKEIQNRLGKLLTGQIQLNQTLSETHQAIIAHYNQGEQRILIGITGKIDEKQAEIVNLLLEEIERKDIGSPEIDDTFNDLQQALVKAGENAKISIPNKNEIIEVINDPQINVKKRLKLIVPIIPFLLNYEEEIELTSGINLNNVWKRLTDKFHK